MNEFKKGDTVWVAITVRDIPRQTECKSCAIPYRKEYVPATVLDVDYGRVTVQTQGLIEGPRIIPTYLVYPRKP